MTYGGTFVQSGGCVEIARVISISPIKSSGERLAKITNVSREEVCLEILRPPLPIQKGEQVRIKCCQEDAAYHWTAGIINLSGPAHETVAISRDGENKAVQRRRSVRVPAEIPLSFTIITATRRCIISQAPFESRTKNISPDGLAFECDLPMEAGDELQISLHFSSSEPLSLPGWVVRSKRIAREGRVSYSIGMEFLELRPEARKQILRSLARVQANTQIQAVSTEERKRLADKRRLLLAELRLLQTMPHDSSAFDEREKAIRAEIHEINRKLGAV